MSHLEKYIERLRQKEDTALADAVQATAGKITPEYIKPFSYREHVVSLLLGNVQSGKTSHLFGLICSAADEGFTIFILLTTDNSLLQQQTLSRVRNDLPEFCVCGETDEITFRENRELQKLPIIVLKKNNRILKKWQKILMSTEFFKGNALFIVDDEADAGSLNTKVKHIQESEVYKSLSTIEKASSSSIYLQVTGTPQALLLQAKESGRRPYFTHYFVPGNGYIGGNVLFPGDRPPYVILTDDEEPDNLGSEDGIAEGKLKQALLFHLVSSADIFLRGGTVSNFLIHPSMATSEHTRFEEKIASYLAEISAAAANDEQAFRDDLKIAYADLLTTKPTLFSLEKISEMIANILINKEVNVRIINSKENNSENVNFGTGINVLIGGNSLGRGITFPKLQTTYYCRVSKKTQADTMWQHARMFGYDRELSLMRVFIPSLLYKIFSDINATNNSIISQIDRKTLEEVTIHYPDKIQPTRKNVLDNEVVMTFTGGVDYFPFAPNNKSIEALDELLSDFGEATYTVSLNFFVNILENIISESDDWKPENFISIVQSMLSDKPGAQGKLVVRRERDIGKGTGTLLSPNDRAIGKAITDLPVLTMYKITGSKGWNGRKIWIPNIKLPGADVYYCT